MKTKLFTLLAVANLYNDEVKKYTQMSVARINNATDFLNYPGHSRRYNSIRRTEKRNYGTLGGSR